jgi:predicted permease
MRRLAARLVSLFRRSRREQEFEDEMAAHLELATADHLANGLSHEEARLAALRRFGGVTQTKEAVRESSGFPAVELAWRDLRFACRLLRRQPLFAASAIVTVALGVGANTAVVSALETVLLNPLGLRQADRVMAVRTQFVKLQLFHAETSGVEFREVRSLTEAFSAVAAMEGRSWTWLVDDEASRLVGQAVTPDFFGVFGEYPANGRFFTPEDNEFCVVLSEGLWRTRFGADPSAVGRTMMLDNSPYRVVGVASGGFRFPAQTQLWTPLILEPGRLLNSERGSNRSLSVFARRKDGVSEAQARDRVRRYVDRLISEDAARNGELSKNGYDIELMTFGRYIAGDLRRPLLLLWGAAFVVLLTGCANIAGLLLARSSSRRHEIAIRIALGATPGQIVRQLLLESLLIGAFGGAAGLVIASLALSLLARLTLSGSGILTLVSLDSRLLLYGFGLALLSGLLFGLAPTLQLVRQNQSAQMGRRRRRWSLDLFVASQVCGAFVLIVMTTLLLRSLWAIERIEPGFDPNGVTTAFFIKPQNDPGFFERLQSALQASPAVQSAALANPVPFGDSGVTGGFGIRNRQEQSGMLGNADGFQITPGYFQTLRIPLLRGRNLAASDTESSPLVCVIDSRLAQQFFPGQDPIGEEIAMFKGWARIVGVVAAIRRTSLESDSRPAVYYSFAQIPFFPWAAVLVRSKSSAEATIRTTVHHTNPSVPVYDVRSLGERLDATLGIRRAMVTLLSTFGAISLLLAIVGLYGVTAQVVSERTHEIGVRMALGARPTQILVPLMRQGLRSGLFGLILGLGAVAYAQQWLAGMLYEIAAFDPITLGAATFGVLMLSSAAVWWPARCAAGIDPQQVLRHE